MKVLNNPIRINGERLPIEPGPKLGNSTNEILKDIGYNLSKEILYNRIDTRVDLMIENGLVDEVKRLTDYKKLNALNKMLIKREKKAPSQNIKHQKVKGI